jgi:hypothetical protein
VTCGSIYAWQCKSMLVHVSAIIWQETLRCSQTDTLSPLGDKIFHTSSLCVCPWPLPYKHMHNKDTLRQMPCQNFPIPGMRKDSEKRGWVQGTRTTREPCQFLVIWHIVKSAFLTRYYSKRYRNLHYTPSSRFRVFYTLPTAKLPRAIVEGGGKKVNATG